MKKIVLATGGFDPLHSGHIEFFKEARKLGNKLIVGINSDKWLENKKSKAFMNFEERSNIVNNLQMVDEVISFDDTDGTACHAIYKMLSKRNEDETIIFVNGGDRINGNTPEYNMYKNTYGLEFVWGVGGNDKKNSSSWILEEWKSPKTTREWGYYRVLNTDGPATKVKELVVKPGKSLSLQKHEKRNEYWKVSYGKGYVLKGDSPDELTQYVLKTQDSITIKNDEWHQLVNDSEDELRIVEIQSGENCIEEDIIRILKH